MSLPNLNFHPEATKHDAKGGEIMSIDAMKTILDAEQEARDAQQKAAAVARQLLQDAETRGKALLISTWEAAEQEVAKLMEEAELLGTQRREEILLHAENQCAVLRAHGENMLDGAAEQIAERIVRD